ncbi:MAG: ribbon-helix-helix protein, CopG family [Chthoniobacterales bacterium]
MPNSPSPSRRTDGNVQRISVSLPEPIFRALDEMVAQRGLENRSKAIAEMISQADLQRRETTADNSVMTGTITAIYQEAKGTLVQRLFELERQYIAEVISSLHVQLENDNRMEVIVVQGPAQILREISDKILACQGVTSCRLTLTDLIIPPLHQRNSRPAAK